MKQFKKAAALLLALALVLGLCACGVKGAKGDGITGTWSGEVDITRQMEKEAGGEVEFDGKIYANMFYEFNKDGTYRAAVEMPEKTVETLVKAMFGMSLDDLKKMYDEMGETFDMSEMNSYSTGIYRYEDGKLYFETDEADVAASAKLSGSTLTFVEPESGMEITLKRTNKAMPEGDYGEIERPEKDDEDEPEEKDTGDREDRAPDSTKEDRPAETRPAPAETDPATPGTDASGDFACLADLYNFYHDKIISPMGDAINNIVEAHNNKLEAESDDFYSDPSYLIMFYMPFTTLSDVNAVMFDKGTALSTVEYSLSFYGYTDISVTDENGAVTISYNAKEYSTEEPYSAKEVFRYDLSSGRYAYCTYKNDVLTDFGEFIPLGGGSYALQGRSGRAIVTLDASGSVSEILHADYIYDTDWETGEVTEGSFTNDYPSCSIWEKSGMNENWVRELEPLNAISRLYRMTGTRLEITGMKSEYDWDSGETKYVPGFSVVIDD